MSWRTIAAAASEDTLEELEQVLWDAGAVSVTVEDGGDNPLFEPGPGETPMWNEVVVSGLFEDDVDVERIKDTIQLGGYAIIYMDELEDRPWEREWLNRFKPMRFGERLWVCPTGQEVEEPDAIILHLDPGLAFGTGTHPTTRLCLEWLDRHIRPGARVMDYGCGSGILGIGALLLGASSVTGIDNDPQALTATATNAERNGVDDRFLAYLPGQAPGATFEVVIANILAKPLIELAPDIVALIADDGWLVLSGIMESQVDWVRSAYPGIEFDDPVVDDGWVRLAGRRG